MPPALSPKVSIVLFRNSCLRLNDNLTFQEASNCKKPSLLLPIYIWETRFNGNLHNESDEEYKNTTKRSAFKRPDRDGKSWNFGFERMTASRKSFLLASLLDVKMGLKENYNSDLTVLKPRDRGSEASVVGTLKAYLEDQNIKEFTLYLGADVPCYEEKLLEKQLLQDPMFKSRLVLVRNNQTMLMTEKLPFSSIQKLPDVYTSFRSAVEKAGIAQDGSPIGLVSGACGFPAPFLPFQPKSCRSANEPSNTILETDEIVALKKHLDAQWDRCVHSAVPFEGGEGAALRRFHDYLENNISTYKQTRNGLLGVEYSSKLSPFLSFGNISPRYIISKLAPLIKSGNEGAYWLWFELLWRDYFYFVAEKYGTRLFMVNGLLDANVDHSEWKSSVEDPWFQAWCQGQTGVPFVDANMRELAATGYMSNRGRQNVASFLVKDLGVDWRLGAEWFESRLLDHDPCVNYGNWLYVAGLGNDPRQQDFGKDGRYFNVIKQGRDYDCSGDFIKMWCPELTGHHNVHAPWIMKGSGGSQSQSYPASPIIIGKGWDRYYVQDTNPKSGRNRRNKKWK